MPEKNRVDSNVRVPYTHLIRRWLICHQHLADTVPPTVLVVTRTNGTGIRKSQRRYPNGFFCAGIYRYFLLLNSVDTQEPHNPVRCGCGSQRPKGREAPLLRAPTFEGENDASRNLSVRRFEKSVPPEGGLLCSAFHFRDRSFRLAGMRLWPRIRAPLTQVRWSSSRPWLRKGTLKRNLNWLICTERVKALAQSLQDAAKWYRKAAEQGVAEAQFRLGELYMDGKGVAQDAKEAATWLEKAAGQGFKAATDKLTEMKSKAKDSVQDLNKALDMIR